MRYFKVTEKELQSLQAVSDSMAAMSNDDPDFSKEAINGTKAIDAILKRSGLQRKALTHKTLPHIDNIR